MADHLPDARGVNPHASPNAGNDSALGFTLPDADARGRLVRLGPVLAEVLAAHAYPPAIRDLLAEALVITALMGALIKEDDGQLTLQARGQGGMIDLLVCDYRNGALRGYAMHDSARLAALAEDASLAALFGAGSLAITYDLAASNTRYQGIVPLLGGSLSEACEAYFEQSEQIPTLIRVALDRDAGEIRAGGLLIQHLAGQAAPHDTQHIDLNPPAWQHVAVLAASLRVDEITNPALTPEALLWRLFHAEHELRVTPAVALRKGCRCSAAHFRSVLSRFPRDERASMANDEGLITVDCAFCARQFEILMPDHPQALPS